MGFSFSFCVEQGKPDLNTALPVRQTASIFKQPVTKITNHPSNKVKSDPQKAVDQPRQVRLRNSWISYWENPKIICFNFVMLNKCSLAIPDLTSEFRKI